MQNELKVWRAKRGGITQRRLAQSCGIPYYRYMEIENKLREPNEAEQAALATALGCEVSDIFQLAAETQVTQDVA